MLRPTIINGKNGFWFSNQGWNQTRLDASGSVSHHQDPGARHHAKMTIYNNIIYLCVILHQKIEQYNWEYFLYLISGQAGWNRIGNQDRDGDSWSWFVSWLIFPSGLRSTLSDSENLTARDFIGCLEWFQTPMETRRASVSDAKRPKVEWKPWMERMVFDFPIRAGIRQDWMHPASGSVSHHQDPGARHHFLYLISGQAGWNRIGNQDRDGDSWSWFVSWLIFPSGLRSTLSDSENLTARDFIGCLEWFQTPMETRRASVIEKIFYIWFQGWNRIGNQDRDRDLDLCLD